MIYLDNAATSGVKPPSVIKAVETALNNYSANPGRSGYKSSIDTSLKIYSVRQKIVDFFSADGPENVAFTLNCTHSLNCILKGVLTKGDHIIVSDLEHNAVMRPLYQMENKNGIEVSFAKISTDNEITVKNFEKLIKPNTKLILSTHASNVTGQIIPIELIGALCAKYNINFAVDAAQTAGVIEINMKKANIDYLAVAPHKGLYSPMGIGILIARKPLKYTVIQGGTGTESLSLAQPEDMPERIESGTVNVPAIFGISAGIDFVKKSGVKQLYEKELLLIKYLYAMFKQMPNVIIYTPEPKLYKSVPVLPFNVVNKHSDDVSDALSKRNIATRAGLHCAPAAHKKLNTLPNGCVRVSTAFFNTKSEMEFLANVIKNLK